MDAGDLAVLTASAKSSSGSSGRPLYQVSPDDYGGDPVAESSVAVRKAVNAAAAYAQANRGYAEVLFTTMYPCNGGLQQGGATKGNGLVPLPPVDPTVGQKTTLALVGVRDASAPPHWAQTSPQISGAGIRTNLTTGTNDGTFGAASVIGGPTPQQGYGMAGNDATFSNMLVVVDGISIVTPADPTFIGFDFNGLAEANVKTASVLANQLPSGAAAPTHNWAMGIRMPAVNNNDNCNIGTMTVEGFYYCYVLNEHTTFQRILGVYGIHGIYAIGGGAHACITGLYASMEVCQAALTIDPGTLCQINIASLDVEDGTAPFNPSWHISDSGNMGRGHIGFNRNPGVGTPLVVIGGSFLEIEYNRQQVGALGASNPAIPASGVAFQNTFWRRASVNIAGGTVTAIAIDGVATGLTSGTFNIPAGHTITLTYSVAPTWNWVLL